jgi:hypothetical protein
MDGKDPNKDLSQLEKDILAKSKGRESSGSSRPGASVVDTRTSAAPAAAAASSSSMSRLEQDVEAKMQARAPSASRPGAAAAGGGGNLTSLERDIIAKTQASANTTSTGTNLSRLEQDIAAKTIGSIGVPASRPGAVASVGNVDQRIASKTRETGAVGAASAAVGSQIDRLQEDVMAKQRGRAPQQVSLPGAVSAGGGGSLTDLERNIRNKSATSAVSGSAVSPTLSRLEADIIAKTQARDAVVAPASRPGALDTGARESDAKIRAGPPAAHPGAMPGPSANALSQLEMDLLSKTRAGGGSMSAAATPPSTGGGSSALRNFEEDVLAKRDASLGGTDMNAVSHLEHSIAQKMQQQEYNRSSAIADTNRPYDHALGSNVTPSRDASGLHQSSPSVYQSTPSVQRPAPVANDFYVPGTNDGDWNRDEAFAQSAPPSRNEYFDSSPPPSNVPLESLGYAPGVTAADLYDFQDPEAPLYPVHGDVGGETAGIEAFVADKVVDATGVAVIMSDEEEEVEIKKRQKRMLMLMALVVIVLLVAVIVPVVILTGGDAAVKLTPAPTTSPTVSPTMSPTTIRIPQLVSELVDFSSVDALEDRSSPQGKAVGRPTSHRPQIHSEIRNGGFLFQSGR